MGRNKNRVRGSDLKPYRRRLYKHGIAAETGWVCFFCEEKIWCGCQECANHEAPGTCSGQNSAGGKQATLDHKVARSAGGGNAITNFVLACGDCNFKKETKTVEEFKAELQARV